MADRPPSQPAVSFKCKISSSKPADILRMESIATSLARPQLEGRLRQQLHGPLYPWPFPFVLNDQLVVVDPIDSDIKRLCSEVLGVGFALELLRSRGVVDGRTIRKLGARFDYEAFGSNGGARVRIEAKGTFSDASTLATENRSRTKSATLVCRADMIVPLELSRPFGLRARRDLLTWRYVIQNGNPKTTSARLCVR